MLQHLSHKFRPSFEGGVILSLYRFVAFHVPTFCIKLCYFIFSSLLGFTALKLSKPRTPIRPKGFDLFFTSVSAATVSSMTAVEMEVFSDSQLILITFLMFLGGEVFTSFLSLVFARINFTLNNRGRQPKQIEQPYSHKPSDLNDDDVDDELRYNSIRYLGYVVLGYLTISNLVGSSLLCLYMSVTPSARRVLKSKGLKLPTFSLFTIVSTFASCGFVPTNENMIVFKKNSGLLLLIMPYLFLGNTLYAPCLRLVIWVMKKVTRRQEFSNILRNEREMEMGFEHLISKVHCWLLIATVFGFNLIQWVLLCCMEWDNMEGLNTYQKSVASLFQVTNARHAGESVFDLSSISPAILVLFILMMYLPPYTTFKPIKEEKESGRKEKRISLVESVLFSQLAYLVMFVILICITERESLRDDPLNFNVLNITLEVISAYGNVGFSTGYSCQRQLKADGMCKDLWIGFSGRWSDKGKFILILVMFFGRLKKFNIKGGKAWDLA